MSDTALKLQPLADRIIVEAISADEVTKAGIILPDTVDKEKPEKGRVVALGSGKLLDNGQRLAWEVKVGDVVFFKKYAPDEIKVDDKEYLILSESDILAVLVR
ncbi:co-chaperone GroES [Candidatus Uhrbacteria bacterium]|nr:co-chaperone GroES [Candidatus Uhrbacteria bacterium]